MLIAMMIIKNSPPTLMPIKILITEEFVMTFAILLCSDNIRKGKPSKNVILLRIISMQAADSFNLLFNVIIL